jgi:hypothetical protein
MKDPKRFFQFASYLQYPLLLLGLFYCCRPFFTDFYGVAANLDAYLIELNKAFVFLGLGVSLSTLRDTTKVQNKPSQWVYNSPRKTSIFLGFMAVQILFFLILGMIGMFGSNKYLQELTFGLISLGVGYIGVLKAAIEMADYQRKKQLANKIISGPN